MKKIKGNILKELSKKIPDFGYLFHENHLSAVREVLIELLENEKKDFSQKLQTPDNKIHFELFENNSLLEYLFGLVSHLDNVNGTKVSRNILEEIEPLYVAFGNEVQFSKRYYEMMKICLQKGQLDREQEKILKESIKTYEVRGINLSTGKQDELKTINTRISDLSRKFSENEIDSENTFSYHSEDETVFSELPDEVLVETRKRAKKLQKKGYVFGPSPTEYIAVMKYCSNKQVRKFFYSQRNKIASEGKYDNRPVILELLQLKEKKAKILGFDNYAELSLKFKMAESVGDVMSITKKIAQNSRRKALEEVQELQRHFQLENIDAEDLSYYFRKYKEERYSINEKELKKYFSYEKCLDGLFQIAEKLYGVQVVRITGFFKDEKDSFLQDVELFEVYKDDRLLSYLMIDPFFRESKRGGAWKNTLRDKTQGRIPIVVNVYNIQKQQEILIDRRELETIFHEFGHALHEILSESKYADLSGSYVEWDFIEVPSQFHEHFCHEKESLDLFARHCETGEKIPQKTLENIQNAENYGNGNMYLTQCQFIAIDMMLHSRKVPNTIEDLDKIILEKVNEFSIIEKSQEYKMYCGFGHIFDGAYAGGYYSYIWSEIIELDIWKEFLKNGIFNPQISQKFYDTILSQGAKKEAKQLFYDFKKGGLDLDGFFTAKGL